jgi:aspartate aminotransferase-like enzyme
VFVSCSERSWEKQAHTTTPRFYLDLQKAREYALNGQTPATPAVNLFFQLDRALALMFEEGMEAIYERHHRLASMTRDGVQALGLELFAEEGSESDTVTAIRVPEGVDGSQLLKVAHDEFDTVFAGGQGSLRGKIIRFGHLGYVTDEHVRDGLDALEKTLVRIGHPVPNRA